MGNNNKRLAQIHKELTKLQSEAHLIKAKHIETIYSDNTYDAIPYNTRSKLQDAKTTISLSYDKEFQKIQDRITELESEKIELGDGLLSSGGLNGY